MKMTIKEQFDNMKHFSYEHYNLGTAVAYYISGATKNRLTRLGKMVDRFEHDTKIDFELGVIDEKQKFIEERMAEIMRNSIRCANQY